MRKFDFALIILLFLSGSSMAQQVESFHTDDGKTLYYYTKGTGPKVVLLYGGPGYGANLMLPWLDSLGNNFECILYDQRGTGLSKNVKMDSTTINLARACRDLENLRIHLGEKKLTLCGYSWGGTLALAYTAHYPDKVKNVIPVSSGHIDTTTIKPYIDDLNRDTYPNEKDSIAYWRKPEIRMQDSVKADMMVSVFTFMNRFYSHKLGRQIMPEYLKKAQMSMKMRSLMTKDMYKTLDLREPLKKYKGNCTNIRPRQDSVPEEVTWKIKESIPQTKIVFIERCGHMVDLEKPSEFFAKIRNALTE
jgi:proline iminopeptidase